MGPAPLPSPIAHQRPAQGEAQELLALQRLMFWMRLAGVVLFLSQVPLYDNVDVGMTIVAALIVVATLTAQRLLLHEDLAIDEVRRRSLYLLGGDLVAVYLVGTAFVASEHWIGFYFYPLMALEGALIAGFAGALGVTVMSSIVYLAQAQVHALFGYPVELPQLLGGVALVTFIGGFMAAFGLSADRGRKDLRVLLDLTSALSHQRDEAETIELLDRRLQDSVGARVRSVAIRNAEGHYEVIRWHSQERRLLDRTSIERSIGPVDELTEAFGAGTALTWDTDAWSVITQSLGLPDWTRSVTMVPIFVEGQWIGILPVLWPNHTIPNSRQLRLIYGLASQMGMALSQGQLQRVREEAATDPLTQLMNRRAILDELAAYVSRADRAGSLMSVLFCDLDGFKAVNDRQGHEAGDIVLRSVAVAVRRAMRQGDIVGRYGGDELLVIASDAGAKEATTLATRIRAAVLEVAGDQDVDVTVGIAVYPADGHTSADLLGAADRAMYRGKLAGTGHVVLATSVEAGEPMPTPGHEDEPEPDEPLVASV